ncbi:hypothetical protein VTI74DRAFT_4326 [Chaetomium olivicolor]
MTSRLPPLLEPYLSLPREASLVVLTSVLGASTNWLVCRHLYALLKSSSHSAPHSPSPPPLTGDATQQDPGNVAVLLVSFLRDFSFWKESLARLGLDLEAAARRGSFGYVDGLAGDLFSQGQGQRQQQQQQQQRVGWRRAVTSATPGEIGRVVFQGVEQLQRGLTTASASTESRERKVVLVIDGLDFVLAASDPTPGAAMALTEMLMELREKTHAAIVTLAADDPLIKEQETTLEKQHAWFTLSMVHQADKVLSLRLLDTGAAKDVSGVIRITHGGKPHTRDHEYLYHVGGDGGVRVFERGQ